MWIDRTWAADLGAVITTAGARIVVSGIAVAPGYLNPQLFASLVIDRPPTGRLPDTTPDLTMLIAAYDEEVGIADTVTNVLGQEYPGSLEAIAIDDGLTDGTRPIVERLIDEDPRLRLIPSAHGGKANALNLGLGARGGRHTEAGRAKRGRPAFV